VSKKNAGVVAVAYEEPDRLAEIILSAGAQSEGGAS
jgi:hypothetical protein